MKTLSIVVPCYNEQESIPLFYPAVEKVVEHLTAKIEYWFVNDGPSDQTLDELEKLHAEHPNEVHFISFSRNFGKEAALYAGLQASTGDYVVVMDVDLQDPPSMLPTMFNYLESGEYDCVGTRRVDRKGEKRFKSFLSNEFYHVINCISKTEIIPGARDYRMMTHQMVNAVLSVSEYDRFSKGIFSWVGFKTKYLDYHNVERAAGETDWSIWKLTRYALDGIMSFSDAPLSLAIWIGMVFAMIAFLGLIVIVIRHFIDSSASAFGWSSLACIILLMGGLQLLFIGIVGKYVGKTYMQSKRRPIYIVRKKK